MRGLRRSSRCECRHLHPRRPHSWRARVYLLTQAEKPPRQHFIDISGQLSDGVARFDNTFYHNLARMVNEEPVRTRDLVAMNQLSSIGIEKGKPFAPDANTQEILKRAILEARAGFMQSTIDTPSYWPGAQWSFPAKPIAGETGFSFEKDGRLDIDARAQLFFLGCAPAKKPGAATFYYRSHQGCDRRPASGRQDLSSPRPS